MKGRVRTRERCDKCGSAFKVIEEVDIFCPTCNTRPKTYLIKLYWKGGKYRFSRDRQGHILDSFRRAHRLVENIRTDIDNKIFSPSDYNLKEIEQFNGHRLFEKWIEGKESQGMAPTHLKSTRAMIKMYFLPAFGNFDMQDIRTHHIEEFFNNLPKSLSLKTKKNIITKLKNFCYWLFKRDQLLRMPQFPVISVPEKPIRWISKENQLKALSFSQPHHRPIFEFLFYHPVRISEARVLKVKDFNAELGTVYICRAWSGEAIRSRKNKKPYYLPISQHFDLSALKDRLPEAFAFTNKIGHAYTISRLERLWHKARAEAGIPEISPYNATRHSIASQARNQGIELSKIGAALGHSSLASTQRYASLDVLQLCEIVDGGAQEGHKSKIVSFKSLIKWV
jgi:integrase